MATFVAMDGFDLYATAAQTSLRTGALTWSHTGSIALVPGRRVCAGLQLSDGAVLTASLAPAVDSPIFGIGVRLDSGASLVLAYRVGSDTWARITLGADGSVTQEWHGQVVSSASGKLPAAGTWFWLACEVELQRRLGGDTPVGAGMLTHANGPAVGAWLEDAVSPLPPHGADSVTFSASGGPVSIDDMVLSAGQDFPSSSGGGPAFETPDERWVLAACMPANGQQFDAGWGANALSRTQMAAAIGSAYGVQVTGLYHPLAGAPAFQQSVLLGSDLLTGPGHAPPGSDAVIVDLFPADTATGLPFFYDPETERVREAMWASSAAAGALGGLGFEVVYTPPDGGSVYVPPDPPPPPTNPALPDYVPEAAVTPWAIRPDWNQGVTERLQWLTDVLISQDGAEQRRRLRQSPRRVIEANFTIWRDTLRLYDSYMAGPQAAVWRVPLWWECNRLVVAVDPTSLSLTFPSAGTEIAAGDTVMVVGSDPFTFDLALVASVPAGGVVLATKLAHSWPEGTSCFPTKKAILVDAQTGTRRSDDALQVQVDFQVVEPNDYPAVRPPDYGDFPVLPFSPDWGTDMTLEHQRMLALFDSQTGRVARIDTGLRAFRVQQFYYTAIGRADASAFRSLLYYLAGRLRPAWVPTFMRDFDFPPGGRHAAGSDFVAVRRSGYTEFGTTGPVGSHTGREVLLIHYRDGTLALYGVAGYVLTDAETETIQLDRPLDLLTSALTVLRMSFVQVMRQDQDEVALTHVTDLDGPTQITTTFRACDVVRRSDPYQPQPVTGAAVVGNGDGSVVVVRPDQSQGVAPGTPPVVVDPVSAALTGLGTTTADVED